MTNSSPWWDYVERIGGSNQSAIAARMTSGGHPFTPASINRWRHSVPKPGNVAAFAITHGRPVLEAFVAAGFITEEQAGAQVTVEKAADLTAGELVAELARRVGAEGTSGAPASAAAPADGSHGEPETAGDRLRRQGPKVAPRTGHTASSRGKRPHESK